MDLLRIPLGITAKKKKKKMQLSLELSQSQLKQTNTTQLYHPPEGKSLPALTHCIYLLLGCVILSLYLTAALLSIFLYVYLLFVVSFQ